MNYVQTGAWIGLAMFLLYAADQQQDIVSAKAPAVEATAALNRHNLSPEELARNVAILQVALANDVFGMDTTGRDLARLAVSEGLLRIKARRLAD